MHLQFSPKDTGYYETRSAPSQPLRHTILSPGNGPESDAKLYWAPQSTLSNATCTPETAYNPTSLRQRITIESAVQQRTINSASRQECDSSFNAYTVLWVSTCSLSTMLEIAFAMQMGSAQLKWALTRCRLECRDSLTRPALHQTSRACPLPSSRQYHR